MTYRKKREQGQQEAGDALAAVQLAPGISPIWSDSSPAAVEVPDSFFISAETLPANRKKTGLSPLSLPRMTTPPSSEAALAAA